MKLEVDWFFYKDIEADISIDLLGIDPISALKFYTESEGADFRRCPAHLDSLKNTYVICSPVDYEIDINKEEHWVNVLTPSSMPKELLLPRFNDKGEKGSETFSLVFGRMIFISRKYNIWIEQIDPFLEWKKKNPIRVISGIFNIYKWVRPIEFAFEQQERNIKIKINRGDPLCYIRFSSGDPSDIIILNKIEQNEKDVKDSKRNTSIKDLYKNKPLDFLYSIRNKYLKYMENK